MGPVARIAVFGYPSYLRGMADEIAEKEKEKP
jgi:hypothetical protein